MIKGKRNRLSNRYNRSEWNFYHIKSNQNEEY